MKNNQRHALLIIAHHHLMQLHALLAALDHPYNDLYVLYDKNASFTANDQAYLQSAVHESTLTLVPRIRITWGAPSIIDAELALIKAALPHHYAYYHMISGSDFPLMSVESIHTLCEENAGKEFIQFCTDGFTNKNRFRAQYYWFFVQHYGRSLSLPCRFLRKVSNICVSIQQKLGVDRLKHFPFSEFYMGSNWFSITHELASYLIQQEPAIKQALKYSFLGDECWVQPIVMNSNFKNHLYCDADGNPTNMRKIDWTKGSPYTWTHNDYEELIASGCFFGRKINAEQDPELIRMLQDHIQLT